jgi:RNase P/RNase MRP subunit POP5
LKKFVPSAIKEAFGVFGLAEVSLNWISVKKNSAIISINREALEKVRASFCIFKERIEIKKVSGTIKGLGKA